MEADVLNEGMELAMEFGKDWLEPIQERLGKRHRELGRAQLDEVERICREAFRHGAEQVRAHLRAAAGDTKRASVTFREVMMGRYPWMNESTLSHLFSQGCYYAWKDGDV